MTSMLLIASLLPLVHGLIGYDCGSSRMNITTVSLVNVGECEIPDENVNVTQRYIQLLQINEYSETTVIQCKLEVRRTVYHCGMHSHISVVLNGEAEYIYDVSREMCQQMHTTGILRFGDSRIIQGLRNNGTVTKSVVYAGALSADGQCATSSFSDHYGSWDSVVVQGTLKISLSSQSARVNINTNQIHLRSGTTCTLGDGTCLDNDGGHTFWRPIPEDSCNFRQYGVLYEGYANKIIDEQLEQGKVVYSLTTKDITFALTAKSRESVCGYTVIRTEHPKLVIFETMKGETFATNKKVSVNNLDIFAYVNSKFIYVEKHIRTQIKHLYRDTLVQRCNLERQTVRNSLVLATQSPDEFASNFMQGPGYMAVMAGEVAHIIRCIPVEVKIISDITECYAELPVEWKNDTYFLTPKTHILKAQGTQTTCNRFLPSYYFVGNLWYQVLPTVTHVEAPMTIKPLTKATWKYVNPAELATTGIYTQKDLNNLRERIMFPVERPAMLNDLAREIHGQPVRNKDGSLFKLLNEDTVNKLVESTWTKIWRKFVSFGTFSAGVLAIFMIFQGVKLVIDVIIRGYTLHSIFGWSAYLIGALWSSLTHLLVHLKSGPPKEDAEKGTTKFIKEPETEPHPTNPTPQAPSLYPQNLPNPNTQATGFFNMSN